MIRLLMVMFTLLAAFGAAATPGSPLPFTPDPAKQRRVIISSDAKNEADDDFAVAHALLTPTFAVRGLIAAHYTRTAAMLGNHQPTEPESYRELQRLLKVMNAQVPLFHGAQHPLDERTQPLSEGAQAIITEAERDDARPLFVLVLGPATDIAQALAARPSIAGKLTVVWIGGNPYPAGGWEYNLYNDPRAADTLMRSKTAIWQVPHNVYMSMRVSLAELAVKVRPQGAPGRYLWQQLLDFNQWASARIKDVPWPKSEVWVLGDNPAVGLLLDDHEYHYQTRPAPAINADLSYGPGDPAHTLRVYEQIDPHFVLEDFFAKLQLAYGS
jgi:hypothetical protein